VTVLLSQEGRQAKTQRDEKRREKVKEKQCNEIIGTQNHILIHTHTHTHTLLPACLSQSPLLPVRLSLFSRPLNEKQHTALLIT
jgi:hypothetical protein